MSKVAVLVSGGVDSSVALALLKKQNKHDLTAFYLKIWLEDELQYLGECPWKEDLKFVEQTCEQLGIPLEVVSLQQDYQERVVQYVLAELREGRTPSPDIFCNQRVKFGAFLETIDASYEFVATGHYAQVEHQEKFSRLLQAVDPVKDQTYFLSHLSQDQLRRCLFPIGSLAKSKVRAIAAELGLPSSSRKDSQGICFLGKIPYDEFVKYHLGENPGPIVHQSTQKVLGMHRGLWFHTFGQRKGLRLHGGPWFVVGKNHKDNSVLVSHANELNDYARDSYFVSEINRINPASEISDSVCTKVRHGPRTYACTVEPFADATVRVQIKEKDAGIADGQFSVFYHNGECLGGGKIFRTDLIVQ